MTVSPLPISGATRTVFVIADPVFQLRTPQAQNAIWQERGLDLVTVPAHVPASHLPGFLDMMRATRSTAGAVVTVPHKQAAAGLCDELGPDAVISGAINAIRRTKDGRLVGETFDGAGFVAGLREQGIDPAERAVLLMGAGGAASAVAAALVGAGIASLDIENRTPAKAEALAQRLSDRLGFADVSVGGTRAADADLVVNATSVGMTPGEDVFFDVERFAADAVAADVIVSGELTPFLAAAAARGLTVHEGRHMLIGQMQPIADFLAG